MRLLARPRVFTFALESIDRLIDRLLLKITFHRRLFEWTDDGEEELGAKRRRIFTLESRGRIDEEKKEKRETDKGKTFPPIMTKTAENRITMKCKKREKKTTTMMMDTETVRHALYQGQ